MRDLRVWIVPILILVVGALVLYPLAFLITESFNIGDPQIFPPEEWGTGNYLELIQEPRVIGNTLLVAGQRTDVLAITSAQMVVADMVPDAPGIWLYHCHISDHMLAGMVARYEVKDR